MTLITIERLRSFAPQGKPELLQAFVDGAGDIAAAGITTPIRGRHFLAEIATETGGLKAIEENLNYSVEGLRATFGQHRISDADCQRYGRSAAHPANPEAIANIVYGGDFGRDQLGNIQPGDGWRYRGGGMLQRTGRANYRKVGHEADPEALRQPLPALRDALKFWTDHKLNILADQDGMTAIRKVINGGTNGLELCRGYLARAKLIFL